MYIIERTSFADPSLVETFYIAPETFSVLYDSDESEELHAGNTINSGNYTERLIPVTEETLHHLPIIEIRRLQRQFCDYLVANRGYDDARPGLIDIFSSGTIDIHVTLEDDFQSDVPRDQQSRHGYQSLTVRQLLNPSTWPSREIRELEVMLARTATSTDLQSKLRCEAAAQFAADLQDRHADLRNLLPGATS